MTRRVASHVLEQVGASRRVLLLGLCLLGFSRSALASDAVARAVEDLSTCHSVEDALCQSALARLTNWGEEAVEPLAAAFDSLPPTGQVLAVTAFARIGCPSSTRFLLRVARKGTPSHRALALGALGSRPGPEVQRALIEALAAPEIPIRVAAAEGLGRTLEGREVVGLVRALSRASSDRSETVAVAAVQSLGLVGDNRAAPAVLGALASPRISLRRAAVFSSRMLSDLRLVPPLIELLRGEDRLLAEDASRALTHLTGQTFSVDYALWRGWWRENCPKR